MGILGTTVLGMIVVATPLAIWVSWTEWMFIGVIVTGIAAAALFIALDPAEPREGRDQPDSSKTVTRLDDQIVAELSNLHPFVYHNRLSAERRLQTTLDKVKEALRGRR